MKGDTMPEFSTMLDLQAQMMLLLAIGATACTIGMNDADRRKPIFETNKNDSPK